MEHYRLSNLYYFYCSFYVENDTYMYKLAGYQTTRTSIQVVFTFHNSKRHCHVWHRTDDFYNKKCSGNYTGNHESVDLAIAQETVVPQEIIDAVSNTGFLESIPLWAVTLLGSIFITILSFVMILTVYGRFFKLYMYTAISPIPLAAAAGESTQSTAFTFIKSYTGVCLEGAIIVLSCIIFSAFASSPPVVDTSASAVTMIWSYIGELIFNMLVLVGTTKMSDRIVKGMMGLQFCGYIVATFVDIL